MTEYRKNMHSAIIHLLGLICKYFMSEQWLTHRDLGDRYMWHKSKFIFIYLCIYLKSTATELESEWQTQGERSFICNSLFKHHNRQGGPRPKGQLHLGLWHGLALCCCFPRPSAGSWGAGGAAGTHTGMQWTPALQEAAWPVTPHSDPQIKGH